MFGYFAKLLLWSFLHCFAALEATGRLEMTCSEHWSRNDNSCYLIFKQPTSWYRAKKECDKNSASLAKISSPSEHRFLDRMMRTSPHKKGDFDYCWIGLHRCQKHGPHKEKFCWLDGSWTNFTAWGPGQPKNNSDRSKECTAQQMNKGLWYDKECTASYIFVCERVLPTTPRISITNITAKSAVVTWKPGKEGSLDISYYRIFVRGIPEQPLFQTYSTSIELKNLQQGTDYAVQVQAMARFGNGKPSTLIVFRTAGELSKPQIKRLTAIKQIQGTSDDRIYLLCEAVGLLPLTFTWGKNGKIIQTQSKIWQTSAQLKVTGTAKRAMAEYECTVSNDRGTDSKKFTLKNLTQCNQEHLVQSFTALHLAAWLSVLIFLVVVFFVIILRMRHRLRNSKRTQSVDEDTRLEITTPSNTSEINSYSDDVSRDVDHNVFPVPIYSSPVLNHQSQSETPRTPNEGELKYDYAYDHRVGARMRLSSLANHTYVNESEVSLDKLKSRKTSQSFGASGAHAQGLDRCRPVSDFPNGRHHYVNTKKSLPEWLKFFPHLLHGGNQTSATSSNVNQLGNSFPNEKIHYVNSSQITDEPLTDEETLNKPESETSSSSQSESSPEGLLRSERHNTPGGEGYVNMTNATT